MPNWMVQIGITTTISKTNIQFGKTYQKILVEEELIILVLLVQCAFEKDQSFLIFSFNFKIVHDRFFKIHLQRYQNFLARILHKKPFQI